MKTASVSKKPPAIPNKAFTLRSFNPYPKENAERWIWFQEVRWRGVPVLPGVPRRGAPTEARFDCKILTKAHRCPLIT